MPYEEQHEWPSFETVLRDVAPDSPTVRALASASRRAQLAADTQTSTARLGATTTPSPAPVTHSPVTDLPAPLEPLELDTSSIRRLLEPRPSTDELSEIAEQALAEVEPIEVSFDEPEPVPIIELEEPEVEVDEVAEVEVEPEPQPDPDVEVDVAVEETEVEVAESETLVYVLADEELAMLDAAEFDAAAPEAAFANPIGTDDAALTSAFEGIDVGFDDFEQPSTVETTSLVDAIAAATPTAAEDLPAIESIAVESIAVEDLNVATLEPIVPPFDFDAPGIELPDDVGAPAEVFEDLAPEFTDFDVVAAADEIETDLVELGELETAGDFEPEMVDGLADAEPPNNVIALPLAPTVEAEMIDEVQETYAFNDVESEATIDIDDLYSLGSDTESDDVELAVEPEPDVVEPTDLFASTELTQTFQPTDLFELADSSEASEEPARRDDPALLTSKTDWVSLDPDPAAEAPDPWEHMRPSEADTTKTGFWANRPKFFGGEDRKRKKAERKAAQQPPPEPAAEPIFDRDCPHCGTECQIDLEDPIGRRVHVSCPSCQHMWHTPYLTEEREAG